MEKYKDSELNEFSILGMKQTKNRFCFKTENVPDTLKLSLMPYIIAINLKKILIVRFIAFFVDKSNNVISNKFIFQMYFKFSEMPVHLKNDNIEIPNIDIIVSVLDTTIGALRCALYKWLSKSEYQSPLPLVEMEGILKQTQFSFVK